MPFETTMNHFLWNRAIAFENEDLELTTVLNKHLKCQKIPQLTEPIWVPKEWDDIMSFMLCGQHLVLPIIIVQLEDLPIASQRKDQNRWDPPEMPTRRRSMPEVSTRSHPGIVPENVIVEHTSYPSNANNGEDDNHLTPPLWEGAIAGGGDDNDRNDSSSTSDDSSSRMLEHSQRSICKPKKVKKINKQADHCKIQEQQQ